MGSISDEIIEGLFCEICGAFIDGDEPGYPRKCEECEKEENKNEYNV